MESGGVTDVYSDDVTMWLELWKRKTDYQPVHMLIGLRTSTGTCLDSGEPAPEPFRWRRRNLETDRSELSNC